MNPAALRANLGDLPTGATIIVDTHDFTARNLDQGRLRRQPARRRLARRVRRAPGRPDRDDGRGGQGVRAVPQGRRPRQEHVRPRPAVVDVRPPDRVHDLRSWRSGFAKVPDIRDANITAFKAGLELRRDHRDVRRPLRDQAGPDGRGHLPQHHRQPRAGLRPGRRRRAVGPAGLPRLLPDHPGLRHPPRARASTSRSASRPSRPRTRSPASARRIGASFVGHARRHHHLRPGHRAQVRGDRPRRDDRAAAAGHRRPARRPLDRAADQDRAGRPAAGDVRPQRRGPGADRRAAVARRLLRRRRSRPSGSRSPTARR